MRFSYFLPARLHFGFGTVEVVGAESKGLGASRVLVVTDKIMVKTGIAQRVTDPLGEPALTPSTRWRQSPGSKWLRRLPTW